MHLKLLKVGIEEESSGVHLPTFDGIDAKWQFCKAKFVAHAYYKALKES